MDPATMWPQQQYQNEGGNRAHTEMTAMTGNNTAFDMTLGSESIGVMENTLG